MYIEHYIQSKYVDLINTYAQGTPLIVVDERSEETTLYFE